MITNNHIAMQLGLERQRDLRAAGSGPRLMGLFARLIAKRLPVPGGVEAVPPAGAAVRGRHVPGRDPHVSAPRIRRTPAGQGASWRPTPRRHRPVRESERAGS